jgi:hypothetical protein
MKLYRLFATRILCAVALRRGVCDNTNHQQLLRR